MKIPLFKIYWDKKDIEALARAVKRGMYWAIGPNIEQFEARIARYVGVKYAVVFNSGTSSLHAAMFAHGIGPGDEVIVPPFSFIATANAPLFVGAKPVFAEIEDGTYGLDPEDVERKITRRTKAILPIHYGGCPCKIRELKIIAKKHRLILIEDAAESLGAMIGDKKVGAFGDSAVLSFCQNKIITTGEGGAVVTNLKNIYERLKLIRSHGRAETANYFTSTDYMDYITLGYNFRMSDITAALGLSQLGKIEKIIKMRRKNARYLTEKLSGIKQIVLPAPPKNYFHVYQMYTVMVRGGEKAREGLRNYLNQSGIMSKIFFEPIHLTTFYQKNFAFRKNDFPKTENISRAILTLPLYPTLKTKEMDYIVSKARDYFKMSSATE